MSSMTSFMEKSLNTDPISLLPPLSPDLCQHTTYPYCMRTNFFDNLSDRFVQGMDVFSRRGLSEWHKLPLIKILTIHAKWSFSVNTAEGESKWVSVVGFWGMGARLFFFPFCCFVVRKAGAKARNVFEWNWQQFTKCFVGRATNYLFTLKDLSSERCLMVLLH